MKQDLQNIVAASSRFSNHLGCFILAFLLEKRKLQILNGPPYILPGISVLGSSSLFSFSCLSPSVSSQSPPTSSPASVPACPPPLAPALLTVLLVSSCRLPRDLPAFLLKPASQCFRQHSGLQLQSL